MNWAKLPDQLKNGTFITRYYEASSPTVTYESLAATLGLGEVNE